MEQEVGKYLLEKRNCRGPSFCPFSGWLEGWRKQKMEGGSKGRGGVREGGREGGRKEEGWHSELKA